MRRPDSCGGRQLTTVKLGDFVSAHRSLRPIRKWGNESLAKMDAKFSLMYGIDVKGSRPSIGPEKVMRAMLLRVPCSVRSKRPLVEQIQYILLYRWFVGLAIECAVWNHSVFSSDRDRLTEHDAAIELLNATAKMADKRGPLSGEHFSVDGTLIQAWASHKSARPKDGPDDDRPPEHWMGQPPNNDTHEYTTDPKSRTYLKRHAVPALPIYLGDVLTDNRHSLVVNIQASSSDGTAERDVAAQMLAGLTDPGKRAMVGAGKAYDTKGFVKARRELNATPHVAQIPKRNGSSAIDRCTTRHVGYEVSQRKRRCIEQCIGWGKLIGPIHQVVVQGLGKVDKLQTLTMPAYNLTRLRNFAQLRPQSGQ